MAELTTATAADLRLAKPIQRAKPADLTHVRVEAMFRVDGSTVTGYFGRHPEAETPTESVEVRVEADEKQIAELRALLVAILAPAMPEVEKAK